MSLKSDIKNTRWELQNISDRGPQGHLITEEPATSERLLAIWDTLIRTQPSRHRMSGWSMQGGKLIAVLGRDGEWHTVTPPPTDED